MAIAATYFTTATVTTSAAQYTVPSTGYNRDLIVTNSGTANLWVGLGSGLTSAATTSSFQVPAGGTVILTQCQVPTSAKLYAISSGTTSVSLGWGSNVSFI